MAAASEPDPLQKLVDSFHTLLDEALIVAIASDYNLADSSSYQDARATLEGLAQNVPTEEATGFNPSGIPQLPEDEIPAGNEERTATSTTSASQRTSQAQLTDKSSTDNSSFVAEPPALVPRLTSFNKNSEEDKVLVLQGMFGDLKEYDIHFALKKAKGDFQSALDDLLNVQYLQSTGQQLKGVDGFFVGDSSSQSTRKKKKNKGARVGTPEMDLSSDGSASPGIISETKAQEEIEYIAERFGIRSDEVASTYHKAQCSKGDTVVTLLEQYLSHGIETKDDAGKEHAEELAKKYRQVPEKYMPTIVHVAGAIPKFADDIAALLHKHFTRQTKGKKLDLSYRLTPLPQDELEEGTVPASGRGALKTPNSVSSISRTGASAPRTMDLSEAVHQVNSYHQARRDAAASAAQMHRKGASSPLYRQAASYYSDVSREQARYAQTATSNAAELLVDQQSTRNSIDLHGVLVQDGVRIAKQRVQDWYQGLGEMRARKLRDGASFTVITGLGRHSAGGVSQMRQGVAAALLQDGWRVRVETGKFVVTGRR